MNTNASNTEHPYIHCAATKELPPAPPLDSLIENGVSKVMVLDFDGGGLTVGAAASWQPQTQAPRHSVLSPVSQAQWMTRRKEQSAKKSESIPDGNN